MTLACQNPHSDGGAANDDDFQTQFISDSNVPVVYVMTENTSTALATAQNEVTNQSYGQENTNAEIKSSASPATRRQLT